MATRKVVPPGTQYGMLVFMEEVEPCLTNPRKPRRRAIFRCACGTIKEYLLENVTAGRSSSCGCVSIEKLRKRVTKHGHTPRGRCRDSPEYSTWASMRARCIGDTKSRKHYKDRGIGICKRWDDYAAFLSDMGNRPSSLHSLDRIDVNGDYAPSNCRWATRKEQARNKQVHRNITFCGRTMCLAEWAECLGIPYDTLHSRIRKGMPLEKAMTRGNLPHSGGRGPTKPIKDAYEA